MKKIAIVTLMSSAAILMTACSKPVTEVKKGESALSTQQSQLSSNNKNDIQLDIDAIQSFGVAQEQKAAPLEQRMQQAMQTQDKQALNNLLNEFKSFVQQSNNELSALKLKSTEVNTLRGKMIESSLIGLEMSEFILTNSLDQVDPAKVQPLQEKAMKTQQELMAISQDIHTKLQGEVASLSPAIPTTE